MTDKQAAFVREYLIDGNATQAAIRAGYAEKSAEVTGSKLLRNAKVSKEIAENRKQLQAVAMVTAERVVKEMARLAFSDIGQLYGEHGQIVPVRQLPEDIRRAIGSVKVRVTGGDTPEETIECKLWDKGKALDQLAKHLGLFKESNDDR